MADANAGPDERSYLLRTELVRSKRKASRALAELADINMAFAGVGPSDARTVEQAHTYFERVEAHVATLGDVEAKLVQTEGEFTSTMVCLNVALIDKGYAKTIMRDVVKEMASAFYKAVVQLNSSFLVRFGMGVGLVSGSVHQRCSVTIRPGVVVPKAKLT